MVHITTDTLATYIERVEWGIEHHATNLRALWPTILVAVLRYADGELHIGTRNGKVSAGPVWVHFGGQRYVLDARRLAAHNYEIIVKWESIRGPIVATLTDTMTAAGIDAAIRGLRVKATVAA
jgi:hypothetical protein